jgi:hypothetical protein
VTFTGKILTVEAHALLIAAATHFTILIPTRNRNDYHDVMMYEKNKMKKENIKNKMKKRKKK